MCGSLRRRRSRSSDSRRTPSSAWLNQPVAERIYHVDGVIGGAFLRLDFSAARAAAGLRAGILTQPSVLAATAGSEEGSPVFRGKLVRVQMLCQDLSPPPPVTAGLISVCVLTSDRKPRCWYNESQGMFAGTALECDSTDPAAGACPPANASANAHELFSKNVVQIATHGMDTFAVTDDHVLWVDGAGWWGLGIGPIPPPDPNAPIPCSTERQDFCGSGGVQKVKLANVARVVVGHGGCGLDATHIAVFSTCAVTTDNALYCWGFNDSGQLGFETAKDMDGKLTPTGDPIKVPLPAPVSDAALGDAHACAATTTGEVYCWGYDAKGQLGDGGGIGGSTPKKVAFQNP